MSETDLPSKRRKIEEVKLTSDNIEEVKITSDNIEESMRKVKHGTNNLIPIISEEYTQMVPCIDVYTAVITNHKDISKAVLTLNGKCPLRNLQHLKRVRKKEIIIKKVDVNIKSIKEFIEENLGEISEIFEEYNVVRVPERQPKLKWQFEECSKIWPCNFHPNKYSEQLFGGAFFDSKELSMHRTYMEVAFEVARMNMNDTDKIGATVVVDPDIDSIVAVSFDNRREHPLQHAAMLAIDKVARTQNGGSWDASDEKFINGTVCGINEDARSNLERKFKNLKFGAKFFKSKQVCEDGSGPYLCTGYYVYTVNEPCVMCAMALVHARARRVFFCYKNVADGALSSKVKLQTISSLNHHFEVFTGFL